MNIHINHKGEICNMIEDKLRDLLVSIKASENKKKCSTREMTEYDFTVLKNEIENMLEYFGE